MSKKLAIVALLVAVGTLSLSVTGCSGSKAGGTVEPGKVEPVTNANDGFNLYDKGIPGSGVFVLMSTWKLGRDLLFARIEADSIPLPNFIESASLGCTTVPGTAVFMTANPAAVPHALLHSMKHYKSLHERVVLLTNNPAK